MISIREFFYIGPAFPGLFYFIGKTDFWMGEEKNIRPADVC